MTATKPGTLTYKESGVDVRALGAALQQIGHLCRRTFGPRVLGRAGSGAGMLRLDFNERIFARNYKDPVLVAATNGVGTKLKLAAQVRKYDTIGFDLAAMCINDLIVHGGEPLFFLDYVAVQKVEPEAMVQILKGMSDACLEAGAALLGGETSETPALFAPGGFDMAGFAVGVVERRKIPDGADIEVGDSVIGLASSGLHANGYALVRRIVDQCGVLPGELIPDLGCTLGDELLKPTRLYARAVIALLAKYKVKRIIKGMTHVTGGGLPGCLPRGLPAGLALRIKRDAWPVPPIFGWLQRNGPVDTEEMYHVFNMGIGFALIVRPSFTKPIMTHLRTLGEKAYFLGKVKKAADQAAVGGVEWA